MNRSVTVLTAVTALIGGAAGVANAATSGSINVTDRSTIEAVQATSDGPQIRFLLNSDDHAAIKPHATAVEYRLVASPELL